MFRMRPYYFLIYPRLLYLTKVCSSVYWELFLHLFNGAALYPKWQELFNWLLRTFLLNFSKIMFYWLPWAFPLHNKNVLHFTWLLFLPLKLCFTIRSSNCSLIYPDSFSICSELALVLFNQDWSTIFLSTVPQAIQNWLDYSTKSLFKVLML